MASLIKRPRSKFWVACFTDRNGSRLKRSTKCTNKKEAQKKADQYEDGWRKKRTALQFRRILTQGYREITGEDISHTSAEKKETTERASKIEAFAKANGLSVAIHDLGLRVTFKKLNVPSRQSPL